MCVRLFYFSLGIRPGVILVFLCLLASVAALLAWLVNIHVALKYFGHDNGLFLHLLLPDSFYSGLPFLSVDKSTVSTGLCFLLFAFPAWAGVGLLRKPGQPLPIWVSGRRSPYPQDFTRFCVFSGLYGTLIGLWLGLPSGTVDAIGDGAISRTQILLDALMEGFRTAIISSIVGLLVALFAYFFGAAFRVCHPYRSEALDAVFAKTREELGKMADAAASVTVQLEALTKQLSANGPDRIQDALNAMVDLLRAGATANTRAELLHREQKTLLRKQVKLQKQGNAAAVSLHSQLAAFTSSAESYQSGMNQRFHSIGQVFAGLNNISKNGEGKS